jgi:hypothetical protein
LWDYESSVWPWEPELTNPPASTSQMLGLQACAIVPGGLYLNNF